jgi:hypothetical protein
MYCSRCGALNADFARHCAECGAALQQPMEQGGGGAFVEHVPNYLVHAILVTLFCCLPFGIVSIVYAAQVDGKLGSGDFEGALISSNNAKKWATVSFVCGLVGSALYVIALLSTGGFR